jgi:septation ring formation regulator EzrA
MTQLEIDDLRLSADKAGLHGCFDAYQRLHELADAVEGVDAAKDEAEERACDAENEAEEREERINVLEATLREIDLLVKRSKYEPTPEELHEVIADIRAKVAEALSE